MSGAMRGVRVLEDPVLARRADPDLLSLALMDSRNRTLRWLSVFEAGGAWAANPDAAHPVAPWRCIGRAGWFQEQWIARHVQRRRGEAADPDAPRLPSIDPMADRWFGPVEGAAPGSAATRSTWRAWSTRDDAPPDPVEVRRYLADTLETTLDLLASSALDELDTNVVGHPEPVRLRTPLGIGFPGRDAKSREPVHVFEVAGLVGIDPRVQQQPMRAFHFFPRCHGWRRPPRW
jgi:hypothetical protein